MCLYTFLTDGSRALRTVGQCLLRLVVVFVAEQFPLLALLAHRLPTSEGVRREPSAGDRERLLAQLAGHASLEGLLVAGCLVTEGEGVETGKALDLIHFISTAGAGEAEMRSLQRNFWGKGSFGHSAARPALYIEWVGTYAHTLMNN